MTKRQAKKIIEWINDGKLRQEKEKKLKLKTK